jgi:hypothetical protein
MNLLDTLLKIGKYIIFGLGILTSFVIFLIIFLVIFVNKIFPEPIPKESFASLDLESSVVYIDYSGDCGATCGFGDVNLYQKSKSFPEDYPELLSTTIISSITLKLLKSSIALAIFCSSLNAGKIIEIFLLLNMLEFYQKMFYLVEESEDLTVSC